MRKGLSTVTFRDSPSVIYLIQHVCFVAPLPRHPAVHLLRALVVLVLLPDGHGGWLWWRAGMGVF